MLCPTQFLTRDQFQDFGNSWTENQLDAPQNVCYRYDFSMLPRYSIFAMFWTLCSMVCTNYSQSFSNQSTYHVLGLLSGQMVAFFLRDVDQRAVLKIMKRKLRGRSPYVFLFVVFRVSFVFTFVFCPIQNDLCLPNPKLHWRGVCKSWFSTKCFFFVSVVVGDLTGSLQDNSDLYQKQGHIH